MALACEAEGGERAFELHDADGLEQIDGGSDDHS